MINKKIMILTIILAFLLAISAVNAAENATSDVVSVEKTMDVVNDTTDEVISVENDNQVISVNESDVGTFDDLANEINAVEEGGVLNLTKDYKYVNGSTEGIQINKPITIDGQGHTLNGNFLSRIFNVQSKDCVLKNINFIRGFAEYTGGIICWYGNNGTIFNCSFSNSSTIHNLKDGFHYGGAVSWYGDLGIISNSYFKNCSVYSSKSGYHYGGAIYWNGNQGSIFNSDFFNCSVYCGGKSDQDRGGAIYVEKNNFNVFNCLFTNNFAENLGGSIFGYELEDMNIINCSFINNSAYQGGAIYENNIEGSNITNCTFLENYAKGSSGAISLYFANEVTIKNSNFINNSADTAGAIYWSYSYDGHLSNCNFTGNFVRIGGSAISYTESHDNHMDNCKFIYNIDEYSGYTIELSQSSTIMNNTYFTPDSHNIIIYNNEEDVLIIKKNTNLFNKDISFYYKNITIFSTFLQNDKINLSNKEILFNLTDGVNFKTINLTTNNDGVASLYDELNDLTVGTWNVTVIFEGDDNYYPCNATATITVLPPSSSLTIDNVNTTVGHEVTLVANVNSTELINEGVVSFFDGETNVGEANVVGGVATLTYTPSVAGEHTITAIFNSDNYGSSNDTALLTVSKADVELSIDYIEVYFTNPSNFAVNVNSNFKPVNEGKVKYYVNNELVGTVDVYEGNANFNYVTGTAGSFTLTAAYEETDNYFAKNASATFNVNKMPTTLSGESIIFDEEAYKTFTTELKDNNNNGVGDQPVKIEVIKYSGESATFNGVSDANGITIYDVGRLAGGMWYVTGIYAGNNNYINSRFVDKFIVVRMNTTTEIEEIDNPKVNHNYKLKANIHDENGKLVKEGIVQFYLDGVDIGSIDLSKNQGHQDALSEGVLGAVNPMFEFVVGADDVSDLYINYVPTKAGKHTLTAVYEGTTIYKASNSTTSFDVSNSNTVETSIVASDVSTVYNGGKYLVIKLKDVNGKAVSGVKVTVVLGGKTFTPTTKNGQAKVSTNGLAPVKTYKATITFKGNSKYDKSTTNAKVVVKKATPKLTAKAKTFKKSVKTKKYSITLKTNQNKVMKNTKLTLKVNGKTYSATTNAKGQATFKITKLTKKGKFTATIKYAGSKYYNAKTVSAKITVK